MIADHIKNASLYYTMSKGIERGLKYLEETDFTTIAPGKYEIDGTDVYMLVQEYNSKPVEEGKWEAHRQHIDIQYIAEGSERMGYAFIDNLVVAKEYNETDDYLLLEGSGNFSTYNAGTFAIFRPDDAHIPGIAVDVPSAVKKVVVKVRI